jgi:hypothetical protein
MNLKVANPEFAVFIAMGIESIASRDFDAIEPAIVVLAFCNDALALFLEVFATNMDSCAIRQALRAGLVGLHQGRSPAMKTLSSFIMVRPFHAALNEERRPGDLDRGVALLTIERY